MAHTATETANNLSTLYEETFSGDFSEPFRITWPELRMMAGVPKLIDSYVTAINSDLSEQGLFLLPFNNYFLVARERDVRKFRRVPGRLLERFLFDAESAKELNDCEIDDDEVETA